MTIEEREAMVREAMKEIDSLKVENEKLKCEISDYQMMLKEQDKDVQYFKGQIEAFRFCVKNGGV